MRTYSTQSTSSFINATGSEVRASVATGHTTGFQDHPSIHPPIHLHPSSVHPSHQLTTHARAYLALRLFLTRIAAPLLPFSPMPAKSAISMPMPIFIQAHAHAHSGRHFHSHSHPTPPPLLTIAHHYRFHWRQQQQCSPIVVPRLLCSRLIPGASAHQLGLLTSSTTTDTTTVSRYSPLLPLHTHSHPQHPPSRHPQSPYPPRHMF